MLNATDEDKPSDEDEPVIPAVLILDHAWLIWWTCIKIRGENEIIVTDNIDDEDSPPNKYELPVVPEGYVLDEESARAILACNDRSDLKKLLAKWKQQSLNARMKHDPAFATSPISVTDKD